VKKTSIHAWALLALAISAVALPAKASVLYSDFGTPASLYSPSIYLDINGSTSVIGEISGDTSNSVADLFTVQGTGSIAVEEVDVAVSQVSGPGTFVASIWTDVGGVPTAEKASWSLTTSNIAGTCCAIESVTGISGLSLTGGTQYFMVLAPVNNTDTSWNGWNENNQGVHGTSLESSNGGSWTSLGTTPFGAFDVLSDPPSVVPEPGTWLLVAGVAFVVMFRRYLRRETANT
jgi:PEP-CTERM motif